MNQKMFLLLLVTSVFVACATQKSWYGSEEQGFTLQHVAVGNDSICIYQVHTAFLDSINLMGKAIKSNTDLSFRFYQTPDLISKNENRLVNLTCDSIQFQSTAPNLQPVLPTLHDALKGLRNKPIRVEISPLGQIKIHSRIDSLLPPRIQSFIDLQATLTQLFPQFTKERVKVGQEWTSTLQYSRKAHNLNLEISEQLKFQVEGIEKIENEEMLRINVTGSAEIQGKERQLNIFARVIGKGAVNGEFYFAYQKGKFHHGEYRKKFNLDYYFPGIENMPVSKSLAIQTIIQPDS